MLWAATDAISNCLSRVAAKCKTHGSCVASCASSCRGRQQACDITAAVLDITAISKVRSHCPSSRYKQVAVAVKCELWRRYAEVQSGASYHVKASMVRQAARSSYTCNEAAMGAAISRHDLSIQQVRPDMQISFVPSS